MEFDGTDYAVSVEDDNPHIEVDTAFENDAPKYDLISEYIESFLF